MTVRGEHCSACPRHVENEGHPFVQLGRKRPLVLILASLAGRFERRLGQPPAGAASARNWLGETYDISPDSIAIDVLVACGNGPPRGVDAAVCRGASAGARPTVVLFTDRVAATLALEAGLIRNGHFFFGDRREGIPYAIYETDGRASRAPLRLHELPLPMRRSAELPIDVLLDQLFGIYGRMGGLFERGGSRWTAKAAPTPAPQRAELRRHLKHETIVAPRDVVGAAKTYVIDVDAHSAIQRAALPDTLAALRAAYPDGLALQSSRSGGIHYFVRLPPGTSYRAAAEIFAYDLARRNLIIRQSEGRSFRACEVKETPPRFPFGPGSFVVGSNGDDLGASVFLDWLASQKTDALRTARTSVPKALRTERLNRPGAAELSITEETGAWAEPNWREVKHAIQKGTFGGFPSPRNVLREWADVPSLTGIVRVLAGGVPAFGLRWEATTILIEHLSIHGVPRAECERLMNVWLDKAAHSSEEIDRDRSAVRAQMKKVIDNHYDKRFTGDTLLGKKFAELLPKSLDAQTLRAVEAVARCFVEFPEREHGTEIAATAVGDRLSRRGPRPAKDAVANAFAVLLGKGLIRRRRRATRGHARAFVLGTDDLREALAASKASLSSGERGASPTS